MSRSHGCFKCKARHHTSLCDKQDAVFTGYIPTTEEKSLPSIIPLEIQGIAFKVPSYNTRIVPSRVNDVKKQSLPLYEVTVKALNGRE